MAKRRSMIEAELPPLSGEQATEMIKLLVRSYYDLQKVRIEHSNRVARLIRDNIMTEEVADAHYGVATQAFRDVELGVKKRFNSFLETEPIWTEWMCRIRGIAEVLASGILCELGCVTQVLGNTLTDQPKWISRPRPEDATDEKWLTSKGLASVDLSIRRKGIACFDTPSKLWAYCGLHTKDGQAARRTKGVKSNWSTLARTLCYKVAECQVKCSGPYTYFYQNYKARDKEKHPVPVDTGQKWPSGLPKMLYTPAHLNMRALRIVSKMFLAHLWEKWRSLNRLPVRQPYVQEYLGHTGIVGPDDIFNLPNPRNVQVEESPNP